VLERARQRERPRDSTGQRAAAFAARASADTSAYSPAGTAAHATAA